MATNYEEYYRAAKDALGPPGKLITNFFETLPLQNARVLDVGCGQGRDALFIARLGHSVTGVDLSQTGIADMLAAARAGTLPITGITADISNWRFDIILFDRTLHMLAEPARLTAFSTIIQSLAPGGWIVIADENPNIAALDAVLAKDPRRWVDTHRKRGNLIVQEPINP